MNHLKFAIIAVLSILVASCASADDNSGWDDAPAVRIGEAAAEADGAAKSVEGNPDRWEYDLENDEFTFHVKRKNERRDDGSRVAYILDLRIRPKADWVGPDYLNIFWVTFEENGRIRHEFSLYTETPTSLPAPSSPLEFLGGGRRFQFFGEWKPGDPVSGSGKTWDVHRAFFLANEDTMAALDALSAQEGFVPARIAVGNGWAEFALPEAFFTEYRAIRELAP